MSFDCVSIFIHTFKRFGLNYASKDLKLQYAIINLVLKCDNVINSDLARTLVVKEQVKVNFSFHIYFTHTILIFFNMNILDTAIETFISYTVMY